MQITSKIKLSVALLLFGIKIFAAEGMWMPDEKGELPSSLRNATIMFGDVCSGVIVSSDGLFLTNHHCALDAIHSQSTPVRNLLQEGFVADKPSDEIPIPDLNVKRLLYTAELTGRIENAVRGVESEPSRSSIIESIIRSMCDSIENSSPFVAATIDPFYDENRWFLQVYEVFRDVRLVLAPPYSIAAFGGEADNWTWPRYSADFAFLRIYAGSFNSPAYYSLKNKPLKTDDYARISAGGYNSSDSMMTVGFPGMTLRYATSWETEALRKYEIVPVIDVRVKKLALWATAMNSDPAVKLAYSSKYAECANYYKYARGMIRCLDSLNVAGEKREQEERLLACFAEDSAGRKVYSDAFLSIKRAVSDKIEERKTLPYLIEALMEGPEVTAMLWAFMELDSNKDKGAYLDLFYRNYSARLDKEVLAGMLLLAKERIPDKYLPSVYDSIHSCYGGNIDAYVNDLFKKTVFRSEKTAKRALKKKSFVSEVRNDPLYSLAFSVQNAYYDLLSLLADSEYDRVKGRRVLFQGRKACEPERNFYPDANFTIRKSFGVIKPLSSGDFYTTPKGLLEKLSTQNPEYALPESLKLFFENAPGDLPLCFISDNDITGGNSGSPVFNSKGGLAGLAFDGNWEGLSGDLLYGSEQRAIHVDIRYILFLVRNWAKAENIYREIMP